MEGHTIKLSFLTVISWTRFNSLDPLPPGGAPPPYPSRYLSVCKGYVKRILSSTSWLGRLGCFFLLVLSILTHNSNRPRGYHIFHPYPSQQHSYTLSVLLTTLGGLLYFCVRSNGLFINVLVFISFLLEKKFICISLQVLFPQYFYTKSFK